FTPTLGPDAIDGFNSLCAHLLACEFALRPLYFSLRIAHCNRDLFLRLALCFTRNACTLRTSSHGLRYIDLYVHVHIDITISVGVPFVVTRQRRTRTQRQSILCVADRNAAVHIAKLDLWTTIANLTIEAVSDVFAVFDFQTEGVRDAAVNRARTNGSICVRRNDQRQVSINRTQIDRLRFVKLHERSLQWTIDG